MGELGGMNRFYVLDRRDHSVEAEKWEDKKKLGKRILFREV
jgi:hypothetical protein